MVRITPQHAQYRHCGGMDPKSIVNEEVSVENSRWMVEQDEIK